MLTAIQPNGVWWNSHVNACRRRQINIDIRRIKKNYTSKTLLERIKKVNMPITRPKRTMGLEKKAAIIYSSKKKIMLNYAGWIIIKCPSISNIVTVCTIYLRWTSVYKESETFSHSSFQSWYLVFAYYYLGILYDNVSENWCILL